MDEKDVSNWSDAQILDVVGQEKGDGEYYIDAEPEDHLAAVVDFEGGSGNVIVDNKWMKTGEEKTRNGKWLFISTAVESFGGSPDIRFIHKK